MSDEWFEIRNAKQQVKQQLNAALALARTGNFQGLEWIVEQLQSDDREVRLKAAAACLHIGFSGAIAALSRMATTDPMSENRNEAIYALAAIGRPSVVSALIAALKDEDVERRLDSRSALYYVLGAAVWPLLEDEEGGEERDPDEPVRVAAWWQAQSPHFEEDLCYSLGKPASPGTFIEELKVATSELPDAILGALTDWTGEDFGTAPLRQVVSDWERWWSEHRASYEPGRRCYYGHRVP